jgi:hypothetical protein
MRSSKPIKEELVDRWKTVGPVRERRNINGRIVEEK